MGESAIGEKAAITQADARRSELNFSAGKRLYRNGTNVAINGYAGVKFHGTQCAHEAQDRQRTGALLLRPEAGDPRASVRQHLQRAQAQAILAAAQVIPAHARAVTYLGDNPLPPTRSIRR